MSRLTIAAAVACAGAIGAAAVASRHAHPAEVSPVVPAGAWNTVWVVGLLAALGLYGISVALARLAPTRLGVIVALAVVAQALPLVSPVLLSKDSFLYWNEGRTIAVHHQSPYRAFPDSHPNDPSLPFVAEQWRSTPPPYGPVFEAMTAVPAAAAGDSARHATFGYRLMAVLGVLAAVGVVAWTTRSAAAAGLIGLNPLVALHFGGGGHSDAWLMALIVLAVAARNSGRAGMAWALAGGIKLLPAVLLPLELARTRGRVSRRFWIGLTGTAIAIAAAAVAAFGFGWVKGTLVGAHITSPLGGVHWLTEMGLRHRYAVLTGAAVFGAFYLWLLREAWRHGRARLSLALTALCLTTSLVRPWYALWPVALAAIEEDTGAAVAAVALSAYFLLADAVSL